jgi:hypothetical protein
MISKKILKSVNRDRLVDAVALLNNSDYVRTQLNLLLYYSELTLTTGKNVLSKCLIAMGKWAKLIRQGKIEGTLRGCSPLRETGDKLEVKTVDLMRDSQTAREESCGSPVFRRRTRGHVHAFRREDVKFTATSR